MEKLEQNFVFFFGIFPEFIFRIYINRNRMVLVIQDFPCERVNGFALFLHFCIQPGFWHFVRQHNYESDRQSNKTENLNYFFSVEGMYVRSNRKYDNHWYSYRWIDFFEVKLKKLWIFPEIFEAPLGTFETTWLLHKTTIKKK